MDTSKRRLRHVSGLFRSHSTSQLRSLGSCLLASLCILLVLLASTLSLAHHHADANALHPDCGLCVTAHMAADVAAALPSLFSVAFFLELVPAEPIVRARAAVQPKLYSRPPPADSHRR